MAGFLGLGSKRVAGLCVSAGLLLVSCTQVVTGKGTADQAALTSYLSSSSSSSSSAASVSSSKASATKQAVCSAVNMANIQIIVAWHNFVTALNNGDTAATGQVGALKDALNDATTQLKSAGADTDIGKAVADYISALGDLSSILNRGKATADEMNNSHEKINTAGQALTAFCPH